MTLSARRLVVKVGSALLVDEAAGLPRTAWLAALAEDIAALRRAGTEVIVVSSGAIALGRVRLPRLPPKARMRLEEKQAAAASGQIALARAWEEALSPHALPAAQLLLTLDDSEERRRYLNARATLETLLALGAVPVINENDTVATSEIRFGDNDRLAARVAEMVAADLLVLLSDIDGLYTADPRSTPGAAHIRRWSLPSRRRSRRWQAMPFRASAQAGWSRSSPRRRSQPVPAAAWRSRMAAPIMRLPP